MPAIRSVTVVDVSAAVTPHGVMDPAAAALAALIEARGREIRADECEQAAESLGDLIIRFAPRTIAGALRARATQHRGDTND